MMTVMIGALIMSAACSGKKGGETADKTAEDKTEMAQGTPKAFPWDFHHELQPTTNRHRISGSAAVRRSPGGES